MVKSYLIPYSLEELGPEAFAVKSGYCFSTHSAAQEHLVTNGIKAPILELDLDERYSTNKLVFNLLVIQNQRSPIEELPQNRSDGMYGHLISSPGYNADNNSLTLTATDSSTPAIPHEIITRRTTDWCDQSKQFVSLSANPAKREVLTFSPAELELQQLAGLLLRGLKARAFAHGYDILNFLAQFVADRVTKDKAKAEELITKWEGPTVLIEDKAVPVIPLTVFLNANAFICRHIALLTAFLTRYLIEADLLPPGIVNLIRYTMGDASNAGHAIVSYSDGKHKWYIDPTGVLTQKNPSTNFPYLYVIKDNSPVVTEQSFSPLASPPRPPLRRAGAFYLPTNSGGISGKRSQPEALTPELTPQQTPLIPSSSMSDPGGDTQPPPRSDTQPSPSPDYSEPTEPPVTRRLRLGT